MADDRFVCAAEFDTEAEATIAAGMLESNGIETHVEGSIMTTIYAAGATWAPVRLLVRMSCLREAQTLLSRHGD